MPFPDDFVWGCATSSYQIEGAHNTHGRGPSIWDAFCRQPGCVRGGDTGDVAADHVNRFQEDVGLMRSMGLQAYRFSIAWPRVMPEGTGAVSEVGIGFYDRLVDELLAAGITPWATLFHWDLPLSIHHRGGWLNPHIPEWFEAYTHAVVDRLSDRVAHWLTLNEPQVFIGMGYGRGEHAPGLRLPLADQIRMGHHVLLAHGRSARVIRERARSEPKIGWAPVCRVSIPRDRSKDSEAALAHMAESVADPIWSNSWWSDPVYFGSYPADGLKAYATYLPKGWDTDLELIRQPLDFCAANIYLGDTVESAEPPGWRVVPHPPGAPRSSFGWAISPEVLYWGPKFLWERYGKPVVITENGIANPDWVNLEGRVEDPQRINYVTNHLLAFRRAHEDGAAIGGYFLWSLMDNFEWAEGYHQRFGVIHIDFETLRRTPKESSRFYTKIIQTNGAALPAVQ